MAQPVQILIQPSRRTFQTDDDRSIRLISKDMPTQAVRFPPKIVGVVEASFHGLPFWVPSVHHIRVGSHLCERNDRALVRDVGCLDLIFCPGVRGQLGRYSIPVCVSEKIVDIGFVSLS